MNKDMNQHYTKSAVGKPYGHCTVVNRGTEHEYVEGLYTFAHGVVKIYAEHSFCSYDFVFKGKIYGLSISGLSERATERQLMIRAGKFGREIVKNNQ